MPRPGDPSLLQADPAFLRLAQPSPLQCDRFRSTRSGISWSDTLLATLADLAIQYEIARELLDEWSGPEKVKAQLFAGLEQHHRAQREPYAMRLAELKQQLAVLPLCGVVRG